MTKLLDAVNRFLTAYHTRMQHASGREYHATLRDAANDVRQLEAVYRAAAGLTEGVKRAPYVRKAEASPGDRTGYSETHESYGICTISRASSAGHRLFGSEVRHQTFITLAIHHASRKIGPYGENIWEDGRVPLVEVHMSAAQFAQAITTMNTSPGAPCTIVRVAGTPMEDPPQVESELKALQSQFSDETAVLLERTRQTHTQLEELLAKKGPLTAAEKTKIRSLTHDWLRFITDNAPHALKMYTEKTEHMLSRAKTEIEAFTSAVVTRLGLDRLPKLPPPKDEG